MAKFEAGLYQKYRIDYPSALFQSLRPYCQLLRPEPLRVLDLGAGTGLASASFARFFPSAEFILVEPDPAMLDAAKHALEGRSITFQSILASAESFSLPKSERVDLVLIASAWHWMDGIKTLDQILSALEPGGALLVFEYQFPKAVGGEGAQLNEWTRREFNTRWKTLAQKPRGSLSELTQTIRLNPNFAAFSQTQIDQSGELTIENYAGVIRSQSRYLAYEDALEPGFRDAVFEDLKQSLTPFWRGKDCLKFQYLYQAFGFRRRNF